MREKQKTGFWKKIVLGASPVPLLVRGILENRRLPFRFIEDHRFPENLLNQFESQGIPLHAHEDFFLVDRHPFRAGMILPSSQEDFSPAAEMELIAEINYWLASSLPRDMFAVFPVTNDPSAPLRLSVKKKCIAVVWSTQGPLLEWLAADREEIPLRVVHAEAGSPANQIVHPYPWKKWQELRYSIVGNMRSMPRRKMLMRQESKSLKIAMLSSAAEISQGYALAFFDTVMFAPESSTAHRRLLEAAKPAKVATFSMDVDLRMGYQTTFNNFHPVLFSGEKKKIFDFPEAPGGRVFRGKMKEGDMVLVFPSSFGSAEMQDLKEIFREEPNEVPSRLSTYLDFRARGRGLLLYNPAA